ncbi:MAG: zinc ribbon domain-containing protein [Treponema sp.]|nr:zinc ribbon domain-containing protein [Treponema sp.]
MFCEECGAQLEEGARFCENCGALVADSAESFSESQKSEILEKGVLLTRLSVLASQLSCSEQELKDKIGQYIDYKKSRGIHYTLMDVPTSSVSEAVSLLKDLRSENECKYVFILGNEDVIEVSEWENKSGDSDSTVTSDLAYSSLCTSSPWEIQEYDIENFLLVGRLPSYVGETYEEFCSYFKNVMNSENSFEKFTTYGLSAAVWKQESDYEYRKIASSATDSSPDVTLDSVSSRIDSVSNILFFNLHGSSETKYWYGQQGSSYPEAFSPENLSALKTPYFLGVEACYGARYIGNLGKDESIVTLAMQSGCIALLGSSKIAYGTPNPTGSCADLMVGEFLKQICAGKTAGASHLAGIQRLFNESKDFSDTEIKTLAEFSLYGDPSASTGKETGFAKKTFSTHSSLLSSGIERHGGSLSGHARGLYVQIPDIRSQIEMSICEVDSKIAAIINRHVYSFHKELAGIEPKTYKFSNREMWQSIYAKQIGAVEKTVKVYFDKYGTIKKELESK